MLSYSYWMINAPYDRNHRYPKQKIHYTFKQRQGLFIPLNTRSTLRSSRSHNLSVVSCDPVSSCVGERTYMQATGPVWSTNRDNNNHECRSNTQTVVSWDAVINIWKIFTKKHYLKWHSEKKFTRTQPVHYWVNLIYLSQGNDQTPKLCIKFLIKKPRQYNRIQYNKLCHTLGVSSMEDTQSECSASVHMRLKLMTSHTMTVVSHDPVTIYFSSNCKHRTPPW